MPEFTHNSVKWDNSKSLIIVGYDPEILLFFYTSYNFNASWSSFFFGGELSNVSCSCFGSMEARDILYGCESFKRSNCLNFVD